MDAVGIDGNDEELGTRDLETHLQARPARKRELASRSRRAHGEHCGRDRLGDRGEQRDALCAHGQTEGHVLHEHTPRSSPIDADHRGTHCEPGVPGVGTRPRLDGQADRSVQPLVFAPGRRLRFSWHGLHLPWTDAGYSGPRAPGTG